MKKVSLFTPCFNEEGNIDALYAAVKAVMDSMTQYEFEYVLIDNDSQDRTVEKIKDICKNDPRVKLIINQKNFGPMRSGMHGFFQTSGDVSICFAADLQDPPAMIPNFLQKWEEGYKVVWGRKDGDEEKGLIKLFRKAYYALIQLFSSEKQYSNVSGFGLYDKEVMDLIKWTDDPMPSLRHLIADFGYEIAFVNYMKPNRAAGKSSYNFWRYYDTVIESLVNTSVLPLRVISFVGMFGAAISFLVALVYLVLKLIFWSTMSIGTPLVTAGLFFLGSVQIFFMGLMGEYVGSIVTRTKKRPMVVEKERVNFENGFYNKQDLEEKETADMV